MMLALDLSTNAGWAYGQPWTGLPRMKCGTWKLPEGTHQERARAVALALSRFLANHPVELAGIEIPQAGVPVRKVQVRDAFGVREETRVMGSGKTQNLLWSLNAACQGVFTVHGIPVRDIGVGEWRKAIFGNGSINGVESKRRSKAELIRMGVEVANQDEGEAGMMLCWLNNHLRRVLAEVANQKR